MERLLKRKTLNDTINNIRESSCEIDYVLVVTIEKHLHGGIPVSVSQEEVINGVMAFKTPSFIFEGIAVIIQVRTR